MQCDMVTNDTLQRSSPIVLHTTLWVHSNMSLLQSCVHHFPWGNAIMVPFGPIVSRTVNILFSKMLNCKPYFFYLVGYILVMRGPVIEMDSQNLSNLFR